MSTKKSPAASRSESRWVRFTGAFDFTWPSRAVTHYPAGFEGRVKAEVADAAVPDFAEEIESQTALDNPENSQ